MFTMRLSEYNTGFFVESVLDGSIAKINFLLSWESKHFLQDNIR